MRLDPAFTGITTRPATEQVEEPFAPGIEAKEPQHRTTRGFVEGRGAANELVIHHPAIPLHNCAPGRQAQARSYLQPLPQYHHIQQITLQPYESRHRPIVKGAGQG